jgi:membrane fusion protein (multidrug efflux system)
VRRNNRAVWKITQKPQRAVTELQGTYQVTVVDETNIVHLRSIKVGEQIGPDWVIENGLNPGDRVVVEGIQKAKADTVVNPKPFAAPTNPPPAK